MIYIQGIENVSNLLDSLRWNILSNKSSSSKLGDFVFHVSTFAGNSIKARTVYVLIRVIAGRQRNGLIPGARECRVSYCEHKTILYAFSPATFYETLGK